MSQFEIVAVQLAALGLTIAVRPGEYVVNVRGGSDATAYFTDDLDDALTHGRAIAAALPDSASPQGVAVRHRKWRRPMSAKAQRRRKIRQHNHRMRARATREGQSSG